MKSGAHCILTVN